MDTKAVQDSIGTLNAALIANPNNACNYLDRAIMNSAIKKYNESFADYSKSLYHDSTNVMAWFSRANTRFKLIELIHSFDDNQPKENTKINNRTNKTQPKKNIELTDNTYQMVINDYSKALQLDPNFTFAWYNRADTKVLTGDYKGAVSDYNKTIELNPNLEEAYFNRGLVLLFLKDNANACKDISKAGELGITESYNIIKRYCYK